MNKQEIDLFMRPLAQQTIDLYYACVEKSLFNFVAIIIIMII